MSQEWITGIDLVFGAAGSVATVLALWLAFREVRTLRRELREREAERIAEAARRRRSQAECVSARLHVEADVAPRYSLTDRKESALHDAWVQVCNASALPIYDVEVYVPSGVEGRLAGSSQRFVPGGQEGHLHTPPQPSPHRRGDPVTVVFNDASGIRWRRHEDGTLCEQAKSRSPFRAVNGETGPTRGTGQRDTIRGVTRPTTPLLDLDSLE